MVQGGAPIDLIGVGTKAGVSADAPWSDMAYKMVSFNGRPVMKLSTGKESLPGEKQVFRLRDAHGNLAKDIIGLRDESPPNAAPLLETVMEGGVPAGPAPSLEQIRERFQGDFNALDPRFKKLSNPPRYPVTISSKLRRMAAQVKEEALGVNVSPDS